jgi:hypothetical protein
LRVNYLLTCAAAHPTSCRFLFLMPLESNYVVINYLKPWEACFGPAEPMDLVKLQSGKKLPCFYRINQWGNIDYCECVVLILIASVTIAAAAGCTPQQQFAPCAGRQQRP